MYEMSTRTYYVGNEAHKLQEARTKDHGFYIGNEEWAKQLESRGIAPTVRPGQTKVCSIGFCEAEQKWYGWSHRAMHGFGIGDSVKHGDCAYMPKDEADFVRGCIEFWQDEYVESVTGHATELDGVRGALFAITYNDKAPNSEIHGTTVTRFEPFPTTWGCGEWTAETLDDAKQMACDYAEGVG